MSDSHRLDLNKGEINNLTLLSDHFAALYLAPEHSDITLKVENDLLPAHKIVLAARSEYFQALLYGGLKESHQTEIELKATSAAPFKLLLKYIYTGRLSLTSLKEEMILEVLALANQYGLVELLSAISEYLQAVLSLRNVCVIYDIACFYQFHALADLCCNFIDRHAEKLIHTESFLNLSGSTLEGILQRDSFCVPEVEIFRVACEWVRRNPGGEAVLNCVRLPLLSLPDLLNDVRSSGLVSSDAILDAIKAKTEIPDSKLPYRGSLLPDENVASTKYGAMVLHGEMRTSLLDGDSSNYDMEKGFTRHPIGDDNNQGIVVRLGAPYIINHIRLLLWDKDMRSYSYYIEVSMDQKDWVRVIDHTRYLCRSWQKLYFHPRVVKYLRVVGTHNSLNRVFHAVTLECMYTREPFTLDDGLLVPRHNVASLQERACVIEGVSRCRNALINGDTRHYDWDSGYTCHQLGSGAIVVQLAQPVMLNSMRLLLWDCDDRTYSYYIEVSVDQQSWTLVVDRRKQPCHSWQHLTFNPTPVVFIRIVGTHNTANEVFHCVHVEAPAVSSISETNSQPPNNCLPSSSSSPQETSSSGNDALMLQPQQDDFL